MTEHRHVTFLFADLSGYSALTEAHGDERAAAIIRRYVEIVEAALIPGARVVERVGDEVVIVAGQPAVAVTTALRVREGVEREPSFPMVRSGLHTGDVLEEGGRFIGSAMNLTARITAYARPGQILCSEQVKDEAGLLPGVRYESLGPVRFRNIAAPVQVLAVVAVPGSMTRTVIDPVCRMQLDAESVPETRTVGGARHYFCSPECAAAFVARPEDYLADDTA